MLRQSSRAPAAPLPHHHGIRTTADPLGVNRVSSVYTSGGFDRLHLRWLRSPKQASALQ
eukprot:GDKH01002747.1.p2 GENE.GDKH01002747.1~~GDKH01002747.1.p2  ORF type:complete len:59 (+),score=0.61 GDKH01002747.1:137-313(+)